ncbi:TPA: hypothetical protein DCL30_03570 [Candidatus Peribacteria bacterium]|nr:MAG: hypothetical protein A3J91_05915 [Candidatus Peribacteria bacterium RIFOXYC2_FULL_58_10]OGJ83902.1 MAG: hypothetical protein A2529_04070 [Candidatus Peribacteria bacterium RIFOXYD2_FULL_58_15]HAI98586.1 hypothetical protein [Candidatus Peribacteria bacterium]HAS34299.1 hypothetical protein [Candidatus Peribacteria bacterium]
MKGKALLRSNSPTRRPRILGGVDEEAQGLSGGALARRRFGSTFVAGQRWKREQFKKISSNHAQISAVIVPGWLIQKLISWKFTQQARVLQRRCRNGRGDVSMGPFRGRMLELAFPLPT